MKTELRLEEFSVDEEDLERIEQTIQGHVARSKMLPALAAEASRAAPHSAGLEEVEEAVAGTDEESMKRGGSGSNLPPAKR